jgi:hypothetical protein
VKINLKNNFTTKLFYINYYVAKYIFEIYLLGWILIMFLKYSEGDK